MRRILIVLAAAIAAAVLVIVLPRDVQSSRTDEPAATTAMPISNTASKAARLDEGSATLTGYLITQTETAPISRSVAAAARVAIETHGSFPQAEKPREDKPTNILLNDAQIAALKSRLELTAEQEQHWPAVEVALRAYVTKQYELQKKRPRAVIQPDPESAELQNLQAAAEPLFASLNDRQKARIRILAGMVGLSEVVAKL